MVEKGGVDGETGYLFIIIVICLFGAAPVAYGRSQARGRIRAAAADLRHSSQQHQIFNPLSEGRDPSAILMDTSWICFHHATMGTP